MIKFLILFIAVINLSRATTDCGPDDNTVQLPLLSKETTPCYRTKGKLTITPIEVEGKKSTVLKLETPVVEFINVPSASVLHYLKVDHEKDGRPIKVSAMTYLCSGEIPIGSEAVSVMLERNLDSQKPQEQEVFIEAGTDVLTSSDKKRKKIKIYDDFIQAYEGDLPQEAIIDSEKAYVPNILLNKETYSEKMRELFSFFFKNTNSPLNACEGNFRKVMGRYLLLSVPGNRSHMEKASFEIWLKRKKE